MMGCRYNAKNSLDKNYLYFAEKHGARVFAETKVVDVACLNGKADGSDGYEVRTVKSTAWLRKAPPPLHLPRGGIRGFGAGQHGSAVPPQGKGLAARDQRSTGQPRAHQCRVADRRARPGQPRGFVEGRRHRFGHSTWTNTRTSRPCATRRDPTPWGYWHTV